MRTASVGQYVLGCPKVEQFKRSWGMIGVSYDQCDVIKTVIHWILIVFIGLIGLYGSILNLKIFEIPHNFVNILYSFFKLSPFIKYIYLTLVNSDFKKLRDNQLCTTEGLYQSYHILS